MYDSHEAAEGNTTATDVAVQVVGVAIAAEVAATALTPAGSSIWQHQLVAAMAAAACKFLPPCAAHLYNLIFVCPRHHTRECAKLQESTSTASILTSVLAGLWGVGGQRPEGAEDENAQSAESRLSSCDVPLVAR